jgi:hypothetical protein
MGATKKGESRPLVAPATTSGLRAGRGSVEPSSVAWSDRGDRKNAGGIGNDWALLVYWTKVVGKQANWIGWSGAMQGFLRELPETAFENERLQL